MADIFLSYSRQDADRARIIADGLEAAGYDVFWDVEIPPGISWADFLEEKLAASKTAIVLWSTNSAASTTVREEARLARDRAKLIPAFIDRVSPPFGFGEIQAADLTGWRGDQADANWKLLLGAVQKKMGEPARPPRPAPKPQPKRAPFAPPPETAEKKKMSPKMMFVWGGVAVFVVLALIGAMMEENDGLAPMAPANNVTYNAPAAPTGALPAAVAEIVQQARAAQSEAQANAREATDAATRATQAASQAQSGAPGYGAFQPDANTWIGGELATLQQGQPGAVMIRNQMSTFAGLVTMQPATGRYMRMVGTTQATNGTGSTAITTFTGDQGRLVGRTFGQGYTAEGVLEGVPTTFNLGGIAVVNYADGSRYEGQFRSVGMQGQIVKQGLGALYNSSGALVQAGRFENDAYAGPG